MQHYPLYMKYSREKRSIHPSPPLLPYCQYQHSDEDECERDGLQSVFHLYPSILVDFSNNLYREVMSNGKKKGQQGTQPMSSPAGSAPPSLPALFSHRMTLIKDC